MLCEAIADTLQDVTAKPFLNHGNHVAKTWLINCGMLTRGASAFLHGNKRLANTLRESSDSIAKHRQMHCLILGQIHIQTLANMLHKAGRSCAL